MADSPQSKYNADKINVSVDLSGLQTQNATLTALAAHSTTGLVTMTSAGVFTGSTITAGTGISVTNGDGVSGNPTIDYDINALTADGSPNGAADYVVTYDASAGSHKKVLLNNVGGGGKVVQEVYAEVTTTASFATVIPIDDTIPQNTEGTEQVTVSITPTNSSNILIIEGHFKGANSTVNRQGVMAFFQDSTANALCAGQAGTQGVGAAFNHYEMHRMTAGTTSSTTFKMRYGSDSGTCYRNADFAGTRLFGGVGATWIRVTEIEV